MNTLRAALETRLVATTGIPAVVLPNKRYERDPNSAFTRAQFTPTFRRPDVRGPNPMLRIDGLYLITICHPMNLGEGPGLITADILLARFKATSDISFTGGKIGINYAELGVGFPDTPFFCTPVVVSWFTYHRGEQS